MCFDVSSLVLIWCMCFFALIRSKKEELVRRDKVAKLAGQDEKQKTGTNVFVVSNFGDSKHVQGEVEDEENDSDTSSSSGLAHMTAITGMNVKNRDTNVKISVIGVANNSLPAQHVQLNTLPSISVSNINHSHVSHANALSPTSVSMVSNNLELHSIPSRSHSPRSHNNEFSQIVSDANIVSDLVMDDIVNDMAGNNNDLLPGISTDVGSDNNDNDKKNRKRSNVKKENEDLSGRIVAIKLAVENVNHQETGGDVAVGEQYRGSVATSVNANRKQTSENDELQGEMDLEIPQDDKFYTIGFRVSQYSNAQASQQNNENDLIDSDNVDLDTPGNFK